MTGSPARVESVRRGMPVRFEVDGVEIESFEGERVSTALLASGRMAWRQSLKLGEPRGLFCGIGICYDCLIEIEGQGITRACQTRVCQGMRARTLRTSGAHL